MFFLLHQKFLEPFFQLVKRAACCFLWIGIVSCLSASTSQKIQLVDFPTDFSLENHPFLTLQDQWVQVRGFWYPLSNEQGLLSTQSGLKSCCLKSSDKIYQQLIVEGSSLSFPAQQVITLKGIFKIEPLYDQKGQLIQLYVLKQAQEVPRESIYSRGEWIAICLSLLSLCFFYFRARRFQVRR